MSTIHSRKIPHGGTISASALGSARSSLISCAACGRRFSREAAACPSCGQPNPNARARAIAMNDCRSRGVYICLALFLGYLGIHNFYAGRIFRALLELFGFPLLFVLCAYGSLAAMLSSHVPAALSLAVTFLWLLLPCLVILLEMLFTTKDGRGVPFR